MKLHEVLRTCVCTVPTSVFFITCGLTWIFVWPLIVDYILVLRSNSEIYNLWQKIPINVPMHFYFFNWTNPESVFNKSVKPKFEQLGPYKFWQTEEKCNITWNENGTITYQKQRFWYYDSTSADNGNMEDVVTFINPVAVCAAYVARSWNYVVRKGLSLALSNMAPTVHIRRSIREVLFEGYSDSLIKIAGTMPFWRKDSFPEWDKFAWYYMRNGSYDFDGVYNMGTGKNSTFGRLYTWNYKTQNPFYTGECLKIERSAGEFYGQNIGDSVAFFSPDIRRTVIFKYVGRSNVHNILGNKYVIEDLMLDNGTIYPENKCYCNGDCVPSGLLNVSATRYGCPLFASLPHFYRADPYYVDSVEGIRPDKNKHEVSITIEPTTGITLEVHAKIQANVLMQPIPGISLYEQVPKIFLPIFWIQQDAKIPSNEAFKLKLILSVPIVCKVVGSLMIVAGIIILIFTAYKRCKREKDTNLFLNQEENIPLRTDHRTELTKNTTAVPKQKSIVNGL